MLGIISPFIVFTGAAVLGNKIFSKVVSWFLRVSPLYCFIHGTLFISA